MKGAIAAVVFAIMAASSCFGDETVSSDDGNRIRFSFGADEIIVSLVENSATRSLVAMLPLKLKFQDHAGTEKISYLPEKLATSDVPPGYDPSVGDLTLYTPWGNLAFFYRDHGYASGLVPLGKIISGASALRSLDGEVSVDVDRAK